MKVETENSIGINLNLNIYDTYQSQINHSGGGMVSILVLRAADHWFECQAGHKKRLTNWYLLLLP